MKHILIDADTGIDDSIAILYALFSDELRVEGISACTGNTDAAQAARNSLGLIRLADCDRHIPVAVGAEHPLDAPYGGTLAEIHGSNGVGDASLPESARQPLDMDAADFIVAKVRELEGELTIVALGPLTNIAIALEREPALPGMVKQLVCMGGTLEVPGNCSPYAEANFYGDPRAADMVLGAGFDLLLVGLDVTQSVCITGELLEAARRRCLLERAAALDFIRSALQCYFGFYHRELGMVESCYMHDPLAMLIAADPSLGSCRRMRAGVEYRDEVRKGMILGEGERLDIAGRREIAVYTSVDGPKAQRRLFDMFRNAEA